MTCIFAGMKNYGLQGNKMKTKVSLKRTVDRWKTVKEAIAKASREEREKKEKAKTEKP